MTDGKSRCCVQRPADDHSAKAAALQVITPTPTDIPRRWSPPIGGSFLMGSNDKRFPEDGEGPVRTVTVATFTLSCHSVSNLQFGDFVRATGYNTDRERFGWSFVFEGLLPGEVRRTIGSRAVETPWWLPVPHAYWAQPRAIDHYPRPPRSSRRSRLVERYQRVLPVGGNAAADR